MIPNIFLKHCKQSLSVELATIFNRSVNQGVFLPEWRESFLTPIQKKYRSHHISPHQHGFLAGKFTITNLVSFTKFVLDSIEAGYQVDVIYTGFSKAFDKIDRNIIIGKS